MNFKKIQAILYFKKNRYDKAINCYNDNENTTYEDLINIASCYILNNDWKNAILYSEKAIKKDDVKKTAYNRIIEAHLINEDYDKALEIAIKTECSKLTKFIRNMTNEKKKIENLIEKSKYELALKELDQLILKNQNSLKLKKTKCDVMLNYGLINETVEYINNNNLLDSFVKEEFLFIIGKCHHYNGDIKKQRETFFKIKEKYPGIFNKCVSFNKNINKCEKMKETASKQHKKGEYNEALKSFEEIINKNQINLKDKIDIWFEMSQICIHLKKYDKSLEYLEYIIECDKTLSFVYQKKAVIYLYLDDISNSFSIIKFANDMQKNLREIKMDYDIIHDIYLLKEKNIDNEQERKKKKKERRRKNFYFILGFMGSQSDCEKLEQEEIKKAWKKKQRENHPDKFTNEEEIKKQTKITETINEAYDVLKDENERCCYDEDLTIDDFYNIDDDDTDKENNNNESLIVMFFRMKKEKMKK